MTKLAMPEFFNAGCLGAVSVFALNNYAWKYQYHNWLTGKLSDLAACFFLPLFFSAILSLLVSWPLQRRVLAGACVTIVVFTLLKTSSLASGWFDDQLSILTTFVGLGRSINIADKADLIALPMTGLAYFYGASRSQT